jgi:translocator protein
MEDNVKLDYTVLLHKIRDLLAWAFVVFFVAWVSSTNMPNTAFSWYAMLNKPSWTPPDWVFAPVWFVLYTSMVFAAYVVQISKASFKEKCIAYGLFFGQLLANGLWTYLFFNRHEVGKALFDHVVLLAILCPTIVSFYRIRPLAGFLLVPYLLWSLFALALQIYIYHHLSFSTLKDLLFK